MPLTSSVAAQQLSNSDSQGTVLGINENDRIGFYGVTPVTRPNVNGLSISSHALTSSLCFELNRLGLIICTSFAP
jgi:hypothetical protein